MKFKEQMELNAYLEQQASDWENSGKESDWPKYFRGLKDLGQQEYFTLSSLTLISPNCPINKFIMDNKDLYDMVGNTGYCEFFKKKQSDP